MRRLLLLSAVTLTLAGFFSMPAVAAEPVSFPPALESYQDENTANVGTILAHRVQTEPFNLVATTIFLLAIVHTFFAPKILMLSHRLQGIPAAILHYLGEVELIFALWAVPLALVLVLAKGTAVAAHYLDRDVSYIEPLFVVVIMAIAASRPVVQLVMRLLALIAGPSLARWWFVLLTVGPLLGSFITEPAAMTLCAVLLGREFYRLKPSKLFCYATLGLLFVNVSVGGVLTNFAAPPVLLVATKWNWSTLFMLEQFGLRALAGIIVSSVIYYLIFRKEFAGLAERRAQLPPDESAQESPVPWWITGVHLALLAWTVHFAREPVFFLGGFLFFLAFMRATRAAQDKINLRAPLLVGLFLAGLVVHGGLQGWWIEPVLSHLGEYALLFGATVLTAFNDNAAITYLATLVPDFSENLKAAVVSGAICGGGLTVIANAPNPAGQSLLQKYFPEGAIRPGALFLAALTPTLVVLFFFALPR